MRPALAFMAIFLCAMPALAAKPLVADLSQYRIELDSGFNGTRLLLFGARNETGDVVVVVRGPLRQITVRKKERVAGIWMNRTRQRFENVPTFYIIAASKPFDEIRNNPLFAPLHIGLNEAVAQGSTSDGVNFAPALIHYQQLHNLYSGAPQRVSFMGESLFKFSIPFPDNIPGGGYSADVYLFNDGQLTGMQSIPIQVQKTGFDAWVYDFAIGHSFLYGVSSVLLALGMGYGASNLMRRV